MQACLVMVKDLLEAAHSSDAGRIIIRKLPFSVEKFERTAPRFVI